MGEEGHPSDGELRRFARGELAGAAARRVVGHLLHRCASCAVKLEDAGLCVFRSKATTHSVRRRPLIPFEGDHPFQAEGDHHSP